MFDFDGFHPNIDARFYFFYFLFLILSGPSKTGEHRLPMPPKKTKKFFKAVKNSNDSSRPLPAVDVEDRVTTEWLKCSLNHKTEVIFSPDVSANSLMNLSRNFLYFLLI